jgi:hypothetical protein
MLLAPAHADRQRWPGNEKTRWRALANPAQAQATSNPKQLAPERGTGPETTKPIAMDGLRRMLVAWGGIEPPTRGFSIRCSTN